MRARAEESNYCCDRHRARARARGRTGINITGINIARYVISRGATIVCSSAPRRAACLTRFRARITVCSARRSPILLRKFYAATRDSLATNEKFFGMITKRQSSIKIKRQRTGGERERERSVFSLSAHVSLPFPDCGSNINIFAVPPRYFIVSGERGTRSAETNKRRQWLQPIQKAFLVCELQSRETPKNPIAVFTLLRT